MGAIANLFGYVLNFLYNFVQNYGLAIILFSLLLKLIMLPISIRQQKTMKKSAKVQEEMNKMQVKYKNNPEKLNQEVMSLYKREKVSPFSGCLSSIIQLIIFLSVFYLVSRPLTYMKKVDSEVISNYEQELTESGESSSYPEIKVIEKKSSDDDRVYINMEFLGLNLSEVPMQNLSDFTVYIIPILYVITTFANIKISTSMNKSNEQKKKEQAAKELKLERANQLKEGNGQEIKEEAPEDQMQQMQQMTNSMNYMMPIMSIAIAFIAPLGLSLYWFISNILQLLERLIINYVSKENESKEDESKNTI